MYPNRHDLNLYKGYKPSIILKLIKTEKVGLNLDQQSLCLLFATGVEGGKPHRRAILDVDELNGAARGAALIFTNKKFN